MVSMPAMYRRGALGVVAAAVLDLMLPATSHAQNAQERPAAPQPKAPPPPPKPFKDQLVGTWRLLISDDVMADGTHVPGYGPNPMGTVIFTADGHYSLQIIRYNRPKLTANSRLKGTADENKAAIQGMISHFGTYSVNEADKTLTFRIEGSSYPNWDGTTQTRIITSLTQDDEVTWTNPTSSSGAPHSELAWRCVK